MQKEKLDNIITRLESPIDFAGQLVSVATEAKDILDRAAVALRKSKSTIPAKTLWFINGKSLSKEAFDDKVNSWLKKTTMAKRHLEKNMNNATYLSEKAGKNLPRDQ